MIITVTPTDALVFSIEDEERAAAALQDAMRLCDLALTHYEAAIARRQFWARMAELRLEALA